MMTQLRRHQGGQATTTIEIGLLKHIMQAKQGQHVPKFPPNTPDFTKKILHHEEAVEHQLKLGAKLTLWGYVSRNGQAHSALPQEKPYNRTTWTPMGQNGNIATLESQP
jgi:hypothetical protein